MQIDGGILAGTGTLGGPVTASTNGGSLEPGTTFTATSVSLDPSTAFAVNIDSAISFSQLTASGGVNLNGANLDVSLNYCSLAETSWVIVDNTNNTPVKEPSPACPRVPRSWRPME